MCFCGGGLKISFVVAKVSSCAEEQSAYEAKLQCLTTHDLTLLSCRTELLKCYCASPSMLCIRMSIRFLKSHIFAISRDRTFS